MWETVIFLVLFSSLVCLNETKKDDPLNCSNIIFSLATGIARAREREKMNSLSSGSASIRAERGRRRKDALLPLRLAHVDGKISSSRLYIFFYLRNVVSFTFHYAPREKESISFCLCVSPRCSKPRMSEEGRGGGENRQSDNKTRCFCLTRVISTRCGAAREFVPISLCKSMASTTRERERHVWSHASVDRYLSLA